MADTSKPGNADKDGDYAGLGRVVSVRYAAKPFKRENPNMFTTEHTRITVMKSGTISLFAANLAILKKPE